MSHPLFSVIVPTHRRAGLLRRALRSIRSQEVGASFQVVVVSDAPDAETDAACREELTDSDTYVRRSGPPGPSASRNLAMSLAQGQCLLFLDDDDALYPHCLAKLLEQPAVWAGTPVYFNCSIVTERRPPSGPEFLSETELELDSRLTQDIYVKNQVPMPCFALPRHVVGGIAFDPFMRAYEDWDFVLAICDRRMPVHAPFLGSRVFKNYDDTAERRGASAKASDFNAVLDYLYVYHRHPAPDLEVARKRTLLLRACGFEVAPEFL